MRTDQSRLRRPGIAAAIAVLAAAGIVGGVSVAGARENTTIYSVENGGFGQCFSTVKKTTCAANEKPVVTIQTGETVTFDMTSSATHNAASKAGTGNAAWRTRTTGYPMTTDTYTFGEAGEYVFYCIAHTGMEGTVIVEGASTVTPTPTPTEEPDEEEEEPVTPPPPPPTFSATPTATATPDDHLTTPAPGKGAKDTKAPVLLRASARPVSGGAKLRFWVSEPSTIEVKVTRKGSKRLVTSATLHVAMGTRAVVVRSSSLSKKGTYTVQWHAVDAMANKGNVAKKTVKVKG